jgi:lysophospholipase L1-like esterase
MKTFALLLAFVALPVLAEDYEPICGPNPVQVAPTEVGRVIVYGDSIASQGWPAKLGWQADGRGCRSLKSDQSSVPTVADRLLAFSTEAVWIAIGTNDYYLSKWSPAAFGAAYGQLLDALSSRTVYAQTPLLRKTDPLNAFGAGLDAYRKAILAECATRPWVICVDGCPLVPTALMTDNVHPSEAGYLTYAGNVRNLFPEIARPE